MQKNSRFTASVAEYVRRRHCDGVYVVYEGMAVGFAFVMGLKTRDIH